MILIYVCILLLYTNLLYIGYVTNSTGQLEFRDGLLVEALRNGHWLILDELNLAPSDVLEALNRLLDDNKELLIPETGEIIRPAPGFTLFATQNPPGIYGGRKPLSRAFKNRFLELSVCDLPLNEVEEIITHSCGIPLKFSTMLVKTMSELQIHRQKSTLFQGKYGSITTRDLIKWGKRQPTTVLDVAKEGYMLIAEKLRSIDEKLLVAEILNKVCKTQLNIEELYIEPNSTESKIIGKKSNKKEKSTTTTAVEEDNIYNLNTVQNQVRSGDMNIEGMSNIAITATMRRMWELVNRAMKQNEPMLLIGETGCGKTTVCQLYAASQQQHIRILNCHQSTETADLIGGLRPIRGRENIKNSVITDIMEIIQKLAISMNITDTTTDSTTASTAAMNLTEKRESPVVALSNTTTIFNNYTNFKLIYDIIQLHSTTENDNNTDTTTVILDKMNNLDESILKSVLDEMSTITSLLLTQLEEDEVEGSQSPMKRSRREESSSNMEEHSSSITKEYYHEMLEQINQALLNWQRCKSLFEWADGPLIEAMKQGDVFVIDEINLAEDAVIERLNSVLESGRSITLAEKGGLSSEVIIAHPRFKLLATMNPGGDVGKRELSPALRSRFTEIWIPSATNAEDIILIVQEILSFHKNITLNIPNTSSNNDIIISDISNQIGRFMIEFMNWMNVQCSKFMLNGLQISVREILAWAKFINQSQPKNINDIYIAYIHGAFMIILDGLGIGMSISREKIRLLKLDCFGFLSQQCIQQNILKKEGKECSLDSLFDMRDFFLSTTTSTTSTSSPAVTVGPAIEMSKTSTEFTVGKFSISLGPLLIKEHSSSEEHSSASEHSMEITGNTTQREYVLDARITSLNLGRILRAMQLPRAILLEGKQ